MAQPTQQPPPPSRKRKDAPSTGKADPNKKRKIEHRARQRDARTLSTQTTSNAFQNGALDVDSFVKAREFEIRALEQGLQRSKSALNRRAFQQVPKELRRRTASHNVKMVPKRLRAQGRKEMLEDNTPTVTARTRKPTKHMRLRLETVKRLRALGAKRKEQAERAEGPSTVRTRARRVKIVTLATPPLPKAKFRKRQVHKSWLPTHLFHAKRAHMTPPARALWRFAVPFTPTQKSYRPIHRAGRERGAVAWDMSYLSTIALEGRETSIVSLLRGLGVEEEVLVGGKDKKWRAGVRTLETFVFERESAEMIAPVTMIWRVEAEKKAGVEEKKTKRSVWIRVHPSAFFQLWEEVVRLGKVAKPAVTVEDLRFEIGSVEVSGPGGTEALLAALWPTAPAEDMPERDPGSVERTWSSLAGLTNANALPSGALLAFNVQDPRLHHPPRTINIPTSQDSQVQLTHLLATWTPDKCQPPAALFSRTSRLRASRLPSPKSIHRRSRQPGQYPAVLPTDPQIPIILYTRSQAATWTLLAPWKVIQPIWYSLMYYPLSTGQQPRFGGLNEKRQLDFEASRPWFPADFPGTKAGWEWEVMERRRREEEWKRKPKGKRVCFEKVDLGLGRIGEAGRGWACDWEVLLPKNEAEGVAMEVDGEQPKAGEENAAPLSSTTLMPKTLSHVTATQARAIFSARSTGSTSPHKLSGKLTTVHLKLVTRGVPQPCARIYRLPSEPTLRAAWLELLPTNQAKNKNRKKTKHQLPKLPPDPASHTAQQRLARSLLQGPLQAGEPAYPACPGEEDLLGFVTTGNFNLAEGQGTGVGCLMVERVVRDVDVQMSMQGRMCILRNSGMDVGRLAVWELV